MKKLMKINVLNVAEKPSVASRLSRAFQEFGSTTTQQRIFETSHSKYNSIELIPVVNLSSNHLPSECTLIVTSVTGHILNLEFNGACYDWNACDPSVLLDAPIRKIVQSENAGIIKNLVDCAKKSHYLVLWLDCDREGENISKSVAEICCKVNSALIIYRARFNSVQSVDLKRAIGSLSYLDENSAIAVDVRQELDFRIGTSITRLMTLKFKRMLPIEVKCLSYGPCQFPTLSLVIARYLRIASFESEPFYVLKLTLKINSISIAFSHNSTTRECFDLVYATIRYRQQLTHEHAVVQEIEKVEVKSYRPKPLDTVTLCTKVASCLKISSFECMKTAESLYCRGYISYPRTETNFFVNSQVVSSTLQKLASTSEFGQIAKRILARDSYTVSAGSSSDGAHEPIHPVSGGADLSGIERQIFRFIALHFLACCDEDALADETRIRVSVSSETYTASGCEVKRKGFYEFYGEYAKWAKLNGEILMLSGVALGSLIPISSLLLEEQHTTAPKLLTEAELITLMDRNRIGTDATMHEHIRNILQRQYVQKTRLGEFMPTKLGLFLHQLLQSGCPELVSVQLRAKTEEGIQQIAQGAVDARLFRDSQLAEYRNWYARVRLAVANSPGCVM